MKIEVEGTAIVEGTSRNKVHYSREELHKFSPTLRGVPIIKDHNGITDNAIGKVTYSESINGGEKVHYRGWIKEDGTGVIDKVKDGRLQVSIGAIAGKLVKESKDSDIVIAKDLTALELSTTPTPGIPGTTLIVKKENYTEEEIKKLIEKYNKLQESNSSSKDDIKIIRKEDKMEANEVKKNEIVENKSDDSAELKAELAESKRIIASMKEAQRQESIATYKAKCSEKGIASMDMSNQTMETIKTLIATIDSIPVKKEEPKEAPKEVAQTKSVEVVTEKKSDMFNGYTIESSSLGGLAFGKF
jgi:hypothetical protein